MRQGLGYPLPLGALLLWLHSESPDASGARAEVCLVSCGQIGEGLFQCNIFYQGIICGHCVWRHNFIPGQCLQINLLRFYNIFGGLGAGVAHIFALYIQFQIHQ